MQKQGHCYSKREEAAWPFLFLNNNDLVFCTLLFATQILDLFSGSQTGPCFQNKNSGYRLTERLYKKNKIKVGLYTDIPCICYTSFCLFTSKKRRRQRRCQKCHLNSWSDFSFDCCVKLYGVKISTLLPSQFAPTILVYQV